MTTKKEKADSDHAKTGEKRRGKWKQTDFVHKCFDIQGFKTWGIECTCNRCGFKTIFIEGHFAQYNFCPNCGADMRGEE